jgi:predicted TIM-barrel fold metal-dependent hydrolase
VPFTVDVHHHMLPGFLWEATNQKGRDPVLRMLRSVVGLDQVVFGSDYPYLRRDLAVASLRRIAASAELTQDERVRVLGGTAARLIPRLAELSIRRQHYV